MKLVLLVCAFGVICVGCVSGQNCSESEFQCDNGKCVTKWFICDGIDDCGDMSDEPGRENCEPCEPDQFQCKAGKCIPPRVICDGFWDCRGDGDDEIDPETGGCPKCPESTFSCKSGGCTRMEYVCDGCRDCDDWSDEVEAACPCANGEFRCARTPSDICDGPGIPGTCIPSEKICDADGTWDCPDGSDEANCNMGADRAVKHNRKSENMSRY